ncbi:MAG: aldehyde dehydrogenase family protein [Candidatus Peribacteria bacterium]|nr:MAG: aldehyde dehydrogenase family protein [Candidatus Peribacteria bacterium]
MVLEQYYDAFVEHMKVHMEALQIGDPMDPTTTLPPIARTDLVATIHDQVQRTLAQGARLVTGGKIL